MKKVVKATKMGFMAALECAQKIMLYGTWTLLFGRVLVDIVRALFRPLFGVGPQWSELPFAFNNGTHAALFIFGLAFAGALLCVRTPSYGNAMRYGEFAESWIARFCGYLIMAMVTLAAGVSTLVFAFGGYLLEDHRYMPENWKIDLAWVGVKITMALIWTCIFQAAFSVERKEKEAFEERWRKSAEL